MKTRTTTLLLLLSLIICNLILSCRKAYLPVTKLSEFVIHDKYGDLYEELTVNRGKYNEESLLFYDIILNSVINKPALSNDLRGWQIHYQWHNWVSNLQPF